MSCSKPNGFLTDVQNFVSFAISRNVRELELDFSDPTWREEDDPEKHPAVVELPFQVQKFYNPKGGFFRVDRDKFGFYQDFVVELSFAKEFGFKKCWNIDHLEICLPNLRLTNLYIDKCNFIQDFFWIEGPNLQFLKYSGKVGHFHMYNQREIVEANLNFGMEPEFGEVGLLL
ncbi:hypothetical protein GH714_004350 [Hevea brasiliensis]|uniref:FBD domain-containing protein n=1 Tax=Hevea brasiliensis TaxID=3981 RepID=A0A6A6L060_HEVBR|nr:hypothetical protein GH714_004350 [Hevea brasiliensis]